MRVGNRLADNRLHLIGRDLRERGIDGAFGRTIDAERANPVS